MFYFKKKNINFDINCFLDTILEAIGIDGTLVLPTYNWDFCKGVDFNYKKTQSVTGVLGKVALKRDDFIRTTNPIYSFAVAGKEKNNLYNLKHSSCFGEDSPFSYFHKKNVKYLSIGVDYKFLGFTPVHYVEEKVGVSYRYFKDFKGKYVDENGEEKNVIYKFYVKDLSKVSMTGIKAETDHQLISIGAMKKYYFCEENFMTIYLRPALDHLIQDSTINIEKNRLIFPIKNDKIRRSKINELNAYQ
tara:strand:- start:344 stop:1081 length:738 start_codon:yes stop_codon:yes gene_type:complete